MASQIKPTSSGAYTTVTLDSVGCCLSTSTGLSSTPSVYHTLMAIHAINVWHNCGGTGEGALRATKVAAAQGILLQEA